MAAKNVVNINIKNDALFKTESGFPQLRIDIDYPEQVIDKVRYPKHHKAYWLSPFRLYKFQVSGGPNGEGDFGSSDVVNLHHVIETFSVTSTPNMSNVGWGDRNENGFIIHEVMKGMANTAFNNFIRVHFSDYDGVKINIDIAPEIDGDIEEIKYLDIYMNMMDAFIFASIIYIRRYYKYRNIPEYQIKWFESLPVLETK